MLVSHTLQKQTHQPCDVRSEQKGSFGKGRGSRGGHARNTQNRRDDTKMRLVSADLVVYARAHGEKSGPVIFCFVVGVVIN